MENSTEIAIVFTTIIGNTEVKDTISDIKADATKGDVNSVANDIATFRDGTKGTPFKKTTILEDFSND